MHLDLILALLFEGLHELAPSVLQQQRGERLFLRFFEWKVRITLNTLRIGMCEIPQQLHRPKPPLSNHHYEVDKTQFVINGGR